MILLKKNLRYVIQVDHWGRNRWSYKTANGRNWWGFFKLMQPTTLLQLESEYLNSVFCLIKILDETEVPATL